MARSPGRGSKIRPAAAKAVEATRPKAISALPASAAKAAQVSVKSTPLVKAPVTPAPVAATPPPTEAKATPASTVETKPPVADKPATLTAQPAPLKAAPIETPRVAPIAQPKPATTNKVVEAKQETPKMAENFTAKVEAKTVFNEVSDQARAAVEKGTKVIEEFNDFTKGNVEALVAAGRAAAKGAETIGQNAAEFSRRSFEDATKAVKTLTAAKSPAEFFKLQNEFAKSQFDALIAEASKASETFVKIFGDVSEPISTRASVAAEKIKTVIK